MTGRRLPPMLHYEALLMESARVGWPAAFKGDLVSHDRRYCETHAPENSFGWVLCDGGTHILRPGGPSPESISRAYGADACRWYFWDGKQLLEYPDAAALAARMRHTFYF